MDGQKARKAWVIAKAANLPGNAQKWLICWLLALSIHQNG
jgi:hypothetical protein